MDKREKGFKILLNAVRARDPKLSRDDAEEVTLIVIREIKKMIVQGHMISFIRTHKGDVEEVIAYALKRFKRN